MIRVIGLGGHRPHESWSDLLNGYHVVARHRDLARQALPDSMEIEHAYDREFDRQDVSSIVETVVDDLLRRARAGTSVAYLVPGVGSVADATVSGLVRRTHVDLIPGATPALEGAGQVHLIDALELAAAESQYPFDNGFAPLEPTITTIITNWHGEHVVALARRRINRYFPRQSDPVANDDHQVTLEPVLPWEASRSFPALQYIATRLRRPDGCPWDRKQTMQSMVPHLIDEMDELRGAIESGDVLNQREEVGDVLMNLMLCAQIAQEEEQFSMADVLAGIGEKMVRRHPHVFGDTDVSSVEEVFANWQRIKEDEKSGGVRGTSERNDEGV